MDPGIHFRLLGRRGWGEVKVHLRHTGIELACLQVLCIMSCFCQDKLASYNVLYQNKQFAFPTFISTNSFTSEYLVVMTTESPFLIYSCFPNYSTPLHTHHGIWSMMCTITLNVLHVFHNGQSTVTTQPRTNKRASDAEKPG